MLADMFETFIEACSKEDEINRICFVSPPGQTWHVDLKHRNLELENIKGADLFLTFRTAKRDEKSGCKGERYVVSWKDITFLDKDSNNIHGLGMSKILPYAEIKLDNTTSLEKYYQQQKLLILDM